MSLLRKFVPLIAVVALALPVFAGDKKPAPLVKPVAGPRATPLRVTWLYVSPDSTAQKVDRVQIGREMVVAERSGAWLRVYANTDIELEHDKDAPLIDNTQATPPISGWMEARGIVVETTPSGDQILMGAAAQQESEANDPRGPINAAQNARLLYRRLGEMFANSPLAAEAAWRTADIHWQIQKDESARRPSSKEREAYMRDQMDEDEMRRLIRQYPNTRQSALAAYALLDNKLCGDWQGDARCPEKESELYEHYANEHIDGPRAAQALYNALYRQAVLRDMFAADGADKKSDAALAHARQLLGRLKDKFPQSDFTARGAAFVFQLEEGIPVYGIDRK